MDEASLTLEEIQETGISTSISGKSKNVGETGEEIPKEGVEKDIKQGENAEHEEGELLETKSLSKETDEDENSFGSHPYKDLLLNFLPTSEQLLPVTHINFPKTLKQTPLCEINTHEDLTKLIEELKGYKEIGVDVEYSDHGYKPLTCLVQLSTTDKDYLIDAIALKNNLPSLNEIFTNATIVKIFHSARNDLKWLQQDCGVYVVSMFDTQKAMKLLGYQKLGLDALLQDYNVVKDKAMQREDFRKRPLPPRWKDYARTDSHYLIPIYNKLKRELIEANLLRQVFNDCNNDCKVVFPIVEDAAYASVVDEIKKQHERQLLVLQKLNSWRHGIAEYLDVNTGQILSKNNMRSLIMAMPSEPDQILKIAGSKHVEQRLGEVVAIMKQGKPKSQYTNPNKRRFGTAQGGFDLRNTLQRPFKRKRRGKY